MIELRLCNLSYEYCAIFLMVLHRLSFVPTERNEFQKWPCGVEGKEQDPLHFLS